MGLDARWYDPSRAAAEGEAKRGPRRRRGEYTRRLREEAAAAAAAASPEGAAEIGRVIEELSGGKAAAADFAALQQRLARIIATEEGHRASSAREGDAAGTEQ